MRSLVLAGGKSSRIGVDKALIKINGESMICRVVNSLSRAGLEPIRVSVARVSDIEDYGSTLDENIDLEWVLDSNTHGGPIEAIEEGLLDHMLGEETLQLAAVDYPWISSDLFVSLQNRIGVGDSLIMPHDGEWLHPLLALIRPKPVLKQIRGDRRPLHIQFSEMSHSLLLEDPKTLTNLNSLEDLK